ncbi:MAG: FtsX-like permease family protein [Chlorobiaceae bacterium]|nr:FtsX-like permease family protein [Chlorobiaceae bacterium]NTV61442.1 FtsX-like permease family protein [Chlorobiaceae bacterium]
MKTGLWIARRFSFARKRFRIINVISAISLAGIVTGVSTLLVVMSVLNGFQKLARDLFTTIESPVQIVPFGKKGIFLPDTLLHAIRSMDVVGEAEPYAEGEAVLAAGDKSELVMVKGITDQSHRKLVKDIRASDPLFQGETLSAGQQLALRTNLSPLKPVKIFSPELISLGLESLSDPYLLPALEIPQSSISSVFSVQRMFDDRYLLTSDMFAQKILLFERGEYSGIDIWPEKGISNRRLEQRIRAWLAVSPMKNTFRVRTLEDKYRAIFTVMQLEKWVSFSVLMLIVLVAALSLTGSLAMTAIDKQRELFYLRCLGLEKPQFMAIFIIQGGMTGIAGTAAGSVIAWGICRLQELYGLVQLPSKNAFLISSYPVSMHAGDFITVGVTAVLLCIAVSLYPARKAALIATSRSLDVKTN